MLINTCWLTGRTQIWQFYTNNHETAECIIEREDIMQQEGWGEVHITVEGGGAVAGGDGLMALDSSDALYT